jgi:hypothetical protein
MRQNIIFNSLLNKGFSNWFLPSSDELNAMYTELYLYGIGNFSATFYHSSSEQTFQFIFRQSFLTGQIAGDYKAATNQVRACRAFTSTTIYNLRDIGPAGGYIFWKSVNNYLESAPLNQSTGLGKEWSNIIDQAVGTTDTAIGTGLANTLAIIGQAGHITSAAALCKGFII